MKARRRGFVGLALLLLLTAPAAHADLSSALNPFAAYSNNIARAAAQNDVGKVRSLILNGNSPNDTDESGRTGLHVAATNGQLQIAAILIKAGATINQRDNIGETPLHHAAERNNTEMLKLLLDVGAQVETQDKNGMTALMFAERAGTELGNP